MTAKPQFGTRRLFALTLLLALALAAGKGAGLTGEALIAGALVALPPIWLMYVALGGIVGDILAMTRRQRISFLLLLVGGILFALVAISWIMWFMES
jgi:hypothetical protein